MARVYPMLGMTPPCEFAPYVAGNVRPDRRHIPTHIPGWFLARPTPAERRESKATHGRKGRRRRARDLAARIREAVSEGSREGVKL